MKYIIFIVINLFIFSCEITDIDYDTYTIKNETNKDVLILAYDKYYYFDSVNVAYLSDSIVIYAEGQYKVEKRTGEDHEPRGYFKSDGVDSVVILFSNQKKLIYVCDKVIGSACFDSRNIMNWHEYSESTCEKNRGCDYVYKITNDDYVQAE
ncbi:MAG: hypothetical protein JXC31_05570 [Acholeplasmataceae bacterium]|nr:hypothetical protein [Acholeplasmataceae bacterium]MBN2820267.1 hypothetical protein [Bacteroidales bacterium]